MNTLSTVEPLNDEALQAFLCDICQSVKVPVRISCQNGHLHCEECLVKYVTKWGGTTCPACRSALIMHVSSDGKPGLPAPAMNEIINSRNCTCPNCNTILAASNLREHYKECPKVLVDCPYASAGCCKKMPRDELDGHIKTNAAEHALLAYKRLSVDLAQRHQQCAETQKRELKQVQIQVGDQMDAVLNQLMEVREQLTEMHQGMRSIEDTADRTRVGVIAAALTQPKSFRGLEESLATVSKQTSDLWLAHTRGKKRKASGAGLDAGLKSAADLEKEVVLWMHANAVYGERGTSVMLQHVIEEFAPLFASQPERELNDILMGVVTVQHRGVDGTFVSLTADAVNKHIGHVSSPSCSTARPVSPGYMPTVPSYMPTSPSYSP